jgi:hypothetical protein
MIAAERIEKLRRDAAAFPFFTAASFAAILDK